MTQVKIHKRSRVVLVKFYVPDSDSRACSLEASSPRESFLIVMLKRQISKLGH